MRITILANRDLASCLALNHLLPDLDGHDLTVFLSSRVGSKPLPEKLRLLKFFEQDIFNEIVFPLAARLGRDGALLGFDQMGGRIGAPVGELNDINAGEGLERFAGSRPDLVLSIRYGVILKEAALAVPRRGVLNLHSGRLPAYRGVMATFWAMRNGEEEIGATVHYIDDSRIDTGPVVDMTSMAVDPARSCLWHVLALYEDGCGALARAVERIAAGEPPPVRPQEPGGAYYSFPDEAALAAFEARGRRLFDPEDALDAARRFMPAGDD